MSEQEYSDLLDSLIETSEIQKEESIEYLDFKEAVTLFLSRTMLELKTEDEIPDINFIFPEKAFDLFEYIKEHPFEKEGCWIPGLRKEDIHRAKKENNEKPQKPTIIVNNPTEFFELLKDITNSWLEYKQKYYGGRNGRSIFISNIKRIFLRITESDLTNIESFLKRQLSFLKSTTFDEYIKKDFKVAEYEGNEIIVSKHENFSFQETFDCMSFKLVRNNDVHSLPSIHFATCQEDDKTICYIYAIQNQRDKKVNKKIARGLYKINAGIENPAVYPGSVLVLKTFIDMLNSKGITEIRIPKLLIMSYPYHVLLSEKTKREFPRRWNKEYFKYIQSLSEKTRANKIKQYEKEKEWYSHVVDKQDFILKTQTEGLFKIFERVSDQFNILEYKKLESIDNDFLTFNIIKQKEKTIK